jgi:hypothetical protein
MATALGLCELKYNRNESAHDLELAALMALDARLKDKGASASTIRATSCATTTWT